MNNHKLLAFGYFGGKFSQLPWLLPLLSECHHYCEPFAGSAAVLLNREPSPVETYNDLDGEVCNFFRVLRDEKDKLIELITFTPFSREEFAVALELDDSLSDLERARRFYVRIRQGFQSKPQPTVGNWGILKTSSNSGMSAFVSRYLGGISKLPQVAERLLRVQIENRPAIGVIQRFDSPDTLFYCDPPYVLGTRSELKVYKNEMQDEDHVALAEVLNSAVGMVALSGYDCELMERLYPEPRWHKLILPERSIPSSNNKSRRTEVFWSNYDPGKLRVKNTSFQNLLAFA